MEISKELLERILRYMEICQDESDYREGWQSDQLQKDIKQVREILKGEASQ